MKRAVVTGLICTAAIAIAVLSTCGKSSHPRLGLFQQHKDIGVTPKKGKTKYNAKKDEYVITGGGANIWAKTDAFQFVYKQISGDVTLTADVHFLGQGVEPHRKAALMIRQSLDPDSAYADVALHGVRLTSLQSRRAQRGYAGDPIEGQRTRGNSDRAAWKSVHDWSGPKGRRTDRKGRFGRPAGSGLHRPRGLFAQRWCTGDGCVRERETRAKSAKNQPSPAPINAIAGKRHVT